MAFNLNPFLGRQAPHQAVNFAEGLFKLGDAKLKQRQLDENARQADQQQANLMARHDIDSTRLEKQRQDVNKRHNVTLRDKKEAQALKYSREDEDKVVAAVKAHGDAVAQGDYRKALGMGPALKAMGVDVATDQNDDGSLTFNVTAPTFGKKEGPFDAQQVETGEVDERKPMETAPERGPEQGRKPDEPVINDLEPEQDVERDVFGAQRFTPEQLRLQANDSTPQEQIDRLQATMGGAPEHPAMPAPSEQPPQTGQQVNPGQLDTGVMEAVTRRRLNPMMGGIIGSYPGRFQDKIGALVSGFADTGLPADKALEMMKAPQAQATSLMKSQMGAEAARSRAALSQSGAGFSEARQRENTAYMNMARKSKQLGVDEAIQQIDNIETIKTGLMSDNPNLIGASLKKLMLMDEKRLTDADFMIGVKGVASGTDEWKQKVHNISKHLSPDQKQRMMQWADEAEEQQKRKLRTAAEHMVKEADSYRYESGRLGANRYLSSSIPQQYLERDMTDWGPGQRQGGSATPRTQANRSSVSVSKSNTSQPTRTAREEADDFL